MKQKVTQLFYFSKWRLQVDKLDDIIRVKAGSALYLIFKNFKYIAGGSISKHFLKEAKILALKLQSIRKDQGTKGLTLFLKSCSITLQQSLSKYRIKDVTLVGPRVSRTRSGLPRIISRHHRNIMINRKPGSYFLMRYYLSIFYIYRVLVFPGKVKLETITNPGKYYDENRMEKYMDIFISHLRGKVRVPPLIALQEKVKIFPIFRSSPFTSRITYNPFRIVLNRSKKTVVWSTHVISLIDAVRHIMGSPLYSLFIEFLNILKFEELKDFFKYQKGLKWLVGTQSAPSFSGPLVKWAAKIFRYFPFEGRSLGKLALKKEAAGKVRVFAMVDPVTQWILAPLHKYLFSILRKIPMDGTFNQLAPIHRLLKRERKGLYSLDLSAATDRLPVRLQARLLDHWFSEVPHFGQKWASLLVSRTYFVKSEEFDLNATLKYAVGQPMGALSSWAMLAIIHHYIVQLAAWEVGYPTNRLYQDYSVLGDDLVIANHRVAKRYLSILLDLGVECGLHKSILSPSGTGLEFAKSTFIDGQNVSPISLDEFSESVSDLTCWAAFSNKYNLSWERQMLILGHGYLSRRKSFRRFNHALQLIFLSQIAKVDFNTDVLKLRRKAPKEFNTIYMEIFKLKVLYPLFSRLFKLLHNYPKWLNRQLTVLSSEIHSDFVEFDRYDLRNAFDLVIGREHSAFPTSVKDLIKSLVPDMPEEDFRALLFFQFNERTFEWMWTFMKVTSFDECLQLYFKLNSQLGRLSLDIYGLEEAKRLPVKKLPIQGRLFQDYSLISHRVISTYRASIKETTMK